MSWLDKTALNLFLDSVPGFYELKVTEQIDYFLYFTTIDQQIPHARPGHIRDCFVTLNLIPYTNIPQYLSDNAKSKGKNAPKFIKTKDGYQLHRQHKITLDAGITKNVIKKIVSNDMRDLLSHVHNPAENEFFKEAIDCYEISAYRAAIVMVWNLTVDHLYQYILTHKLTDFNAALAKNTDKRVKITSVALKDDFSEIPENKFIEFCRSGNVVSNDVRKILETKLGIRNSYAHPSNIKILEIKASEFISDLITNVILKYSI